MSLPINTAAIKHGIGAATLAVFVLSTLTMPDSFNIMHNNFCTALSGHVHESGDSLRSFPEIP